VNDPRNLDRFLEAQQGTFDAVLAELRAGAKRSHWMWFIFPQLRGLGHSPTSQFYGIESLDEAQAYLDHPLLGARLRQCVELLLHWAGRRSAEQILGAIDALKLRSSLTLFDLLEPRELFHSALSAFYQDQRDERTLALLNGSR
jgi:uncharacterized protein (DUF1810 family)